jgi:hypothetical protein
MGNFLEKLMQGGEGGRFRVSRKEEKGRVGKGGVLEWVWLRRWRVGKEITDSLMCVRRG